MIKNNKTDATNIGSVLPFELLANNQRLFGSYYAEETEQLQQILEGNLKRHRRVIRLYRCFACDKNRTAQKMSNCPCRMPRMLQPGKRQRKNRPTKFCRTDAE